MIRICFCENRKREVNLKVLKVPEIEPKVTLSDCCHFPVICVDFIEVVTILALFIENPLLEYENYIYYGYIFLDKDLCFSLELIDLNGMCLRFDCNLRNSTSFSTYCHIIFH